MDTTQVHWKVVEFPHLRASVKFFDLSKLRGVPVEGAGYTTIMTEDPDGNLEVGVFLQDIDKNVKKIEAMPTIFHELLHTLQYICQKRGIEMQNEMESVAYMGHFLAEELLTPSK